MKNGKPGKYEGYMETKDVVFIIALIVLCVMILLGVCHKKRLQYTETMESKYQDIISDMSYEKWDSAIDKLYDLDTEYSDTNRLINRINSIKYRDDTYDRAIKYYNDGLYISAYGLFVDIGNYKDSDIYREKCLDNIYPKEDSNN